MKILSVFAGLLISGTSLAQNITTDTISWHVDQLIDERANITENYFCEFVTLGSNAVRWLQAHQSENFPVQSSSGGLIDIAVDGEKTFVFEYYNKPAKLVFARSDDRWTISLEVLDNGQNIMPYKFRVTSAQTK